MERFAHERRVSRNGSWATTTIQDEARQPDDPAGFRAKEDRALWTRRPGLEGSSVDNHGPREDARGDDPDSATDDVPERLVEVLGVEPSSDVADVAFAEQRANRAGRCGGTEEDLLLVG